MDENELIARAAIHDLVHSYAVMLDTGKMAELAQLFATDAVLNDSYGSSEPGPENVIAYLQSAINIELPDNTSRPKFMRHNITTHRVRMTDGSSAKADTYFMAVTDVGPDHWGRYRDDVVRTAEGWRFGHRAVIVEGYGGASWYAARAAAGEAASK